MRKLILISLILFAISGTATYAYSPMNPFVSPSVVEAGESVSRLPSNPFLRKISLKISAMQSDLNQKLNALGRQLKSSRNSKTILLSLFFAFLFGIVHALGPGHGKLFTATYFLAEDAKVAKGLILGSFVAFLHAGMSILLVTSLYFIFKQSLLISIENFGQIMKIFSFSLIALLGAFMIFLHSREIYRERKMIQTEDRIDRLMKSNKGVFSLALAIGLVPCPGTTLILLFALSIDMLGFGIFLALSMALGMAITISAIGLVSIFFRKGSMGIAGKNKKVKNALGHGLELTGAGLIFAIGIFMLFATL